MRFEPLLTYHPYNLPPNRFEGQEDSLKCKIAMFSIHHSHLKLNVCFPSCVCVCARARYNININIFYIFFSFYLIYILYDPRTYSLKFFLFSFYFDVTFLFLFFFYPIGMTLNFDVNPISIQFNLIHSLMASPILSKRVALSISVVNSISFTNSIPLFVPTNHCFICYLIYCVSIKAFKSISA